MDSRSSLLPRCAQAPTVQFWPLSEVQRPMPNPPQPAARSPANHFPNAALKTRMGSPKFVAWPVANGDGRMRLNVSPPLVETERPERLRGTALESRESL